MGYTTDFKGAFTVTPPLSRDHAEYLEKFSSTRRMKRNPDKLNENANAHVGLPLGEEGAYYVDGAGFAGQNMDASVVDGNWPPEGQPSLWCQWVPSEDGTKIEWDEGEKFYEYEVWIEYIVEHFLKPWGYTLNGTVEWQGESSYDFGQIVFKDNEMTIFEGVKTFEPRD
jgi:hypothetical protein